MRLPTVCILIFSLSHPLHSFVLYSFESEILPVRSVLMLCDEVTYRAYRGTLGQSQLGREPHQQQSAK